MGNNTWVSAILISLALAGCNRSSAIPTAGEDLSTPARDLGAADEGTRPIDLAEPPPDLVTCAACTASPTPTPSPLPTPSPSPAVEFSISTVSPNPAMVTTVVTVHGAAFSVPAFFNVVTLGGVTIHQFESGGTDSAFSFPVPAIVNLAADGTLLPLTVTNQAGSTATATLLVQPFVQKPSGTIVSTPAQLATPAATLASPDTVKYTLTVTPLVSMDASYSAILLSTNPAFHPVFLDSGGASIGASTSFDLPANSTGMTAAATLPLTVEVDVDGSLADGAAGRISLLVVCTSENASVQALNATIADRLSVGSAIPNPAAAGLSLALVGGATTASGAVMVTRPDIGQTALAPFTFQVASTVADTTTVTAVMVTESGAAATGWSTTEDSNIPVLQGVGSRDYTSSWTLTADAVNATLQVTAQNSSSSTTYYLPIVVSR